jgi:hypothetical protein
MNQDGHVLNGFGITTTSEIPGYIHENRYQAVKHPLSHSVLHIYRIREK